MINADLERLIYIYTAQILLSLIISALFYFYYRNYNRPFLKWWSISWAAYTLFYIFSISLTVFGIGFSSFGIILFSYLQVLFLIIGVNEFSTQKKLNHQLSIGFVLVFFFSLASYYLFKNDPEAGNYRYVIRVGIKSLLIGFGFAWVAVKILFSNAFKKSFSKLFLVTAFALYSLQQFWHSGIVFCNAAGFDVPFPLASFGIIDLFSMAVIGIGMITWLLDNQHNRLQQTNKELDNFLYSTSHDLRGPIASVLGLTNLAKLETQDLVAVDYFNRIESRIKKLDQIVGDILNYAKSVKMPVTKEKIDFLETVNDIFKQLQFASNQNEITLTLDTTSPQYFYSDPTQISIILSNLIGNSIKYADSQKSNSYIEATMVRENGVLRISIKDNGIGIADENIPKVFDMFYRATNVNEGSGLGLYIAREAIRKLDGKFEVTSSEGRGSTFTIVLNENWI